MANIKVTERGTDVLTIPVEAINKSQLAIHLNMSVQTFHKWVKAYGLVEAIRMAQAQKNKP